MRRKGFLPASAVVTTLCVGFAWGQTRESRVVSRARVLYYEACTSDEDRTFDEAGCRHAFDYIHRALKSAPSSLVLSVLYAAAEISLDPRNSQADAETRLRAAVRAKPEWEEPYLLLLAVEKITVAEKDNLLRRLLRANSNAGRAYVELISRLSIRDADKYAAEIVELCARYRAAVSFDVSSNIEIELRAVDELLEAGRPREAATILGPIIEFGMNSSNPVSACAELLNLEPEDFRGVPDLYAKFLRSRMYCTVRDHEEASRKLLTAGKLREAIEELELQIKTNPYYLSAFPELATLYLQLANKDNAVRVFDRFISGDWSVKAKCGTLVEFGDLSVYRVSGDPTLDRLAAECKGVN